MDRTDKEIIVAVIVAIIIYLITWLAGFLKHHLFSYVAILNVVGALAIIIYWVQHELSITQHTANSTEIAVLCFEALIVVTGIYSFLLTGVYRWIKILQFTSFGFHLAALIFFLIFMLSFKITKLF